MTRRVEGAALLVAGHGAIGGTPQDAAAVHTLGQIGEALLATEASWQIRRLSAAVGERFGADRGSIKHHIDELVAERVRVAIVVVLGVIADARGPALVTSSQVHEYPEDATLPLGWIGDRLRACRAEQLMVVLAGKRAAGTTAPVATWLDALATGRRVDITAVDETERGAPLIEAVLGGLCGDAIDPRTGTVTMRSLSEHLGRHAPRAAVAGSDVSQTLASSPPFGGMWDVRRTARIAKPRSPDGEDLTGTVLPGRFRLEAMVARGSFGTVYRARQLSVERDVAIKVLHSDIDPASEDGRLFVHEVRAVGRIDHANVVRIHQADITRDGRLFYAMELLDGRDLQQLGRVAKERAVELIRQLLAGLGAAHDAGLVHADVKPANAIVVDREGVERVVLVDFGLARLRSPDRPSESAGGTPAYMAPEQLDESRVDARSDLFSAALVLVTLLTGWRRTSATMVVPPLDDITDRELVKVLARALEIDPAKRYQTAGELAAALTGTTPSPSVGPHAPVTPFRLFAPMTESDRDRLYGREADVGALVEHVLYRRSVMYTAPSGTGKTSLLRAALVPRLDELGARVIYLRCRNASPAALAAAIAEGAASVADAIARHARDYGGKLVLVLDQVEAALAGGELVTEALAFARWPDGDVSVVLSVREDHLARLVTLVQDLEPGMPIVRLPPLGLSGARAAIVGPLAEARLAIEPELLDVLLGDLERAAAALAPEMGWGVGAAVYPPHLQLACSVLYDALGPGEATLTLAHYRSLGGFAAIVGEHLERVLDVELAGGRDAIARDLFMALVTTGNERAMRPEAELIAIAGARHGTDGIAEVLEVLRARGLLVRVRGEGEPAWELVHDSLVPRVLAWIDRRDLARRRAVELVRYHLRRSRSNAPSLLGRDELRELREHESAIAELDDEWRGRGDGWTPTRLVERSRRVLRRRSMALAGVLTAAAAVATTAWVLKHLSDARAEAQQSAARAQQSLADRNLGRFVLELAPFDWDAEHQRAIPVAASTLQLRWQLHEPARDDHDAPSALYPPRYLQRGTPEVGVVYREPVEARGASAFLVIDGRGAAGEHCLPSIVPVRVPGYLERDTGGTLRIAVPTCRASKAGTIEIPAGPLLYGGHGEPPIPPELDDPELATERRIELPGFAIDRTEVTYGAFSVFAAMSPVTGIAIPTYPERPEFAHATGPDRPIAGLTWPEARAYCRYLGKQLPSNEQWERALRGGAHLTDGSPNPMPRRSLPWGAPVAPIPANIKDAGSPGAAPVGSFPGDRSPDGVYDLGGNVTEWTDTIAGDPAGGFRVVRGGDWSWTTAANLLVYVHVRNQRPALTRDYAVGMRCVYDD